MTLTYEIRNKAVPNEILVISINSELKFDCVAIPKTWTFISAFHPISMKLSLNWFCEIRAGMFNFSVSWVQTQNLYLVSWPSPSLDYLQCVLESQLRYNFLSWDQTPTLICWKLFSNLRNQSRAMITETLSPVFICLVWNWRLTDSLIFFIIMWRLDQRPFWRTATTQYFKPSCDLSHHRVFDLAVKMA